MKIFVSLKCSSIILLQIKKNTEQKPTDLDKLFWLFL